MDARRGQPHDPAAYRAMLEEIGYLVDDPEDVHLPIKPRRDLPTIMDPRGRRIAMSRSGELAIVDEGTPLAAYVQIAGFPPTERRTRLLAPVLPPH